MTCCAGFKGATNTLISLLQPISVKRLVPLKLLLLKVPGINFIDPENFKPEDVQEQITHARRSFFIDIVRCSRRGVITKDNAIQLLKCPHNLVKEEQQIETNKKKNKQSSS
jgi:hypothetical protein